MATASLPRRNAKVVPEFEIRFGAGQNLPVQTFATLSRLVAARVGLVQCVENDNAWLIYKKDATRDY